MALPGANRLGRRENAGKNPRVLTLDKPKTVLSLQKNSGILKYRTDALGMATVGNMAHCLRPLVSQGGNDCPGEGTL
jgi:hypothetical protein